MNSTTNADKITEWLNQYVDVAFGPLLEKIALGGTPVQWKKDDFARTLCMHFEAGEITYAITLDPAADPVAGQLLFQTAEGESRKSFSPALSSVAQTPGAMTGSDVVNDLIEQYGQWCKRQAAARLTVEHEVRTSNRTRPADE